jgi:hypothetical protein
MPNKDVVTVPRAALVQIARLLETFDYFDHEKLSKDDKFVLPRWAIVDVQRARAIVRHVLTGGVCLVCGRSSKALICDSCLAETQLEEETPSSQTA